MMINKTNRGNQSASSQLFQMLLAFSIVVFSVSFVVFSFKHFQEYKEYPHICVMGEHKPDDSSFRKIDSATSPSYGYEMYEYQYENKHDNNENNNNNNNQQQQKILLQDSIYFIHGNSGDHGESRWMFAEFSKIFKKTSAIQQNQQEYASESEKHSKVEIPHVVDLYTFSFKEEANIHSGSIVQRQAEYVFENVLSNHKKSISSSSSALKKRCVWFLAHSMGGNVARLVAEKFSASSTSSYAEIDICGIFVLASPQAKLPIHLDSKVAHLITDQNRPRTPIMGIIISASNGAADIQVYENTMSKLSKQVRRQALVAMDVSTLTMSGLSTSHHGITYCHQLVRPLMKSLVWLMSARRVTETLKSARHYHAGSAGSEPEMASHIRQVLDSCFFSSSSPISLGVADEADADPEKQGNSQWLSELMKNGYEACSNGRNSISELGALFEDVGEATNSAQPRTLLLSATEEFDLHKTEEVGDAKTKNTRAKKSGSPIAKSLFSKQSSFSSLTTTSPAAVSFGVPWRRAIHDVFSVQKESQEKDVAFLKAITIVGAAPSYKQLFSKKLSEKSASSNLKQQDEEKKNERIELLKIAKEEARNMKREKLLEAKKSADKILESNNNNENHHHHHKAITNPRRRIFFQQENVSASDAYWIRIAFYSSLSSSASTNKNDKRQLLPTVLARCGKPHSKKNNNNNNNEADNEIRFLVPLVNSEILPEPLLQNTDQNKYQYSWMWIPTVTGILEKSNKNSDHHPSQAKSKKSASDILSSSSFSSFSCELMLLSSEALCNDLNNNNDDDEGAKNSETAINCWKTSVTPASYNLRALHASRHCNSAHELIFSTSLMISCIMWILSNFILAINSSHQAESSPTTSVVMSVMVIIASTMMNVVRTSFSEEAHCTDTTTLGLVTVEILSSAVVVVGACVILVGVTQLASFRLCATFVPRAWFQSKSIRRCTVAVTALLCMAYSPFAPILVVFASEFVGRSTLQQQQIPSSHSTASDSSSSSSSSAAISSQQQQQQQKDNVFVRHAQLISKTFAPNPNYLRLISVLAMICTLPNAFLTLRNLGVTQFRYPLAHAFLVHDYSNILLAAFLVISCLCMSGRQSPFAMTTSGATSSVPASATSGVASGTLRVTICIVIALNIGEPLVSNFDCSQLRFMLIWCGIVNSLTLVKPSEVFAF